MRKIGFIGAGNMAQAMIHGMILNQLYDAKEIVVFNHRYAPTLEKVVNTYHITPELDIHSFMKKVDIVVLAIKPAIVPIIIEKIKADITDTHLILSIAAGVSIQQLQEGLGHIKVTRVMPNTPAMVGEGMSSLSFSKEVTKEDQIDLIKVTDSFGQSQIVTESLIDAVIGVSGSSPAYVYMFIEALADGAVAEGMPRDQAYIFAAQAVLGSAKMVLESDLHPGQLKDQVCSPGGTTIEAVQSLENNHFRATVINAVRAASQKNKDLM